MGAHKLLGHGKSRFDAVAADRGSPVPLDRVKMAGPAEMDAVIHAFVRHDHEHRKKYGVGPRGEPQLLPFAQPDGRLRIYLRSLDVETFYEVAAGRWSLVSDEESAAVEPQPLCVTDRLGMEAAMRADDVAIGQAEAKRNAAYGQAQAALFLFDRSPDSARALRAVTLRRADQRAVAVDWFEASEAPYLALYLAIASQSASQSDWIITLRGGAFDDDASALVELARNIADVAHTLLRVETLPDRVSAQLVARWQVMGGMVLPEQLERLRSA